MRELPTFQDVVKDLENHQTHVVSNAGYSKHLTFSKGSSIDHFNITTWPYHLAISGDRGTYVFSRYGTEDMMTLFRMKPESLDLKYISEKCVSVDRHCRISDYDPDRVKEYFTEYIEDNSESLPESVLNQIRSGLVTPYFEFEYTARDAVDDFYYTTEEYTTSDEELFDSYVTGKVRDTQKKQIVRPFQNFWEVNLNTYNYNYVWCVYAIIWAVGVYDKKW